MKKAKKNYYYWAVNERVDGKIKIKLYRALSHMEKIELQEKGIISEPLEPIYDKDGRNVLIESEPNYPSSRDNEIQQLKQQISNQELQLIDFKRMKIECLDKLTQWIEDIETGKLKNTPSLRPKAFITKVLNPMMNL